jgi:hypothetical protein
MLGPALYEVCLTCTWCWMFPLYLAQLSMKCVWLVPFFMLFSGFSVQLSTRFVWLVLYVRIFPGYFAQLSTKCVWLAPYVSLFPAYLTQLSTRYVWLVPYVMMCVLNINLYNMLACFPDIWSTSRRGVFDLKLCKDIPLVFGPVHYNMCLTCT